MVATKSHIQYFSIFQWVVSFLFGGIVGGMLTMYVLVCTSYWWLALGYLVFMLVIDRNTPTRGGRSFTFIRRWRLWKIMASYFPAKLHKTCELDVNENYLLCIHPHGILSIGAFLNFATDATEFSSIFKGIQPYLAVLEGHFKFPLYRDYLMSGGGISCKRNSLEYVLGGQKGRGNLVCLIPGGALEALEASPGKYKFRLSDKFGFIRVAITTGAKLLPCITFGEVNVYSQVPNPPGSLIRRIQTTLTKYLGISPPLFYGIGILPRSSQLNTVVGRPINVKANSSPTREEIENLKIIYLANLKELFNENRHKFDPHAEDLDIF